MSAADSFCYVIWCDDVRQELGNKPSFMGVYTGALVVPTLPAVLPRLTAWVVLSMPFGMPWTDVAVTVARDDGEELISIPAFNPPMPEDSQLRNGVPATRAQLMFALTMAPLQLPESCKYLSVTAKISGLVLEAPKLHIQTAQPGAPGNDESYALGA